MELPTSVKIVFLLVSAAYASPALNQARRVFNLTPASLCTAPTEVICSSDCREVLLCRGDGAGGYQEEQLALCDVYHRCSPALGACVEADASECHPPIRDIHFRCNSVGRFPDPYDCQVYHVCSEVDGFSDKKTCAGDWAFNPLRGDCSLKPSDRVCTEGPIPPCTKIGQIGVVPENPAIYYICKKTVDELDPEMYKCDGNLIFDIEAAACVAQ